jgi:hypothetical protein
MLEKLASLIDPFISFEENEVLEKGHIKKMFCLMIYFCLLDLFKFYLNLFSFTLLLKHSS